MTKEDLEKNGVVFIGSRLQPNLFFIPYIGEVNLYEPYSMEYIYETIYEKGYNEGIEVGKKLKTNEIKRVLEIE